MQHDGLEEWLPQRSTEASIDQDPLLIELMDDSKSFKIAFHVGAGETVVNAARKLSNTIARVEPAHPGLHPYLANVRLDIVEQVLRASDVDFAASELARVLRSQYFDELDPAIQFRSHSQDFLIAIAREQFDNAGVKLLSLLDGNSEMLGTGLLALRIYNGVLAIPEEVLNESEALRRQSENAKSKILCTFPRALDEDSYSASCVILNAASTARYKADFDTALGILNEAFLFLEGLTSDEIGLATIAEAYSIHGEVLLLQEDYEEALDSLEKSRNYYRQLDSTDSEHSRRDGFVSQSLLYSAECYASLEQGDKARQYLDRGLDYASRVGNENLIEKLYLYCTALQICFQLDLRCRAAEIFDEHLKDLADVMKANPDLGAFSNLHSLALLSANNDYEPGFDYVYKTAREVCDHIGEEADPFRRKFELLLLSIEAGDDRSLTPIGNLERAVDFIFDSGDSSTLESDIAASSPLLDRYLSTHHFERAQKLVERMRSGVQLYGASASSSAMNLMYVADFRVQRESQNFIGLNRIINMCEREEVSGMASLLATPHKGNVELASGDVIKAMEIYTLVTQTLQVFDNVQLPDSELQLYEGVQLKLAYQRAMLAIKMEDYSKAYQLLEELEEMNDPPSVEASLYALEVDLHCCRHSERIAIRRSHRDRDREHIVSRFSSFLDSMDEYEISSDRYMAQYHLLRSFFPYESDNSRSHAAWKTSRLDRAHIAFEHIDKALSLAAHEGDFDGGVPTDLELKAIRRFNQIRPHLAGVDKDRLEVIEAKERKFYNYLKRVNGIRIARRLVGRVGPLLKSYDLIRWGVSQFLQINPLVDRYI